VEESPINWESLSSDPNNAQASLAVRQYLSHIETRYEGSRSEWLATLAEGQDVLDIGGGEHVPEASDGTEWEHAILSSTAKSICGVDISRPLVDSLVSRGFNFVECDATSATDLGTRYDLVFAGDVIEHVNDPVQLVRFGVRHLKPTGTMIVTTPNPFHLGDPVQSVLRRNRGGRLLRHVNLQHTTWITPTNMLEISRRADCLLTRLWKPKAPGNTGRARAAHAVVRAYASVLGMHELTLPEFAYEIRATQRPEEG